MQGQPYGPEEFLAFFAVSESIWSRIPIQVRIKVHG